MSTRAFVTIAIEADENGPTGRYRTATYGKLRGRLSQSYGVWRDTFSEAETDLKAMERKLRMHGIFCTPAEVGLEVRDNGVFPVGTANN